MNGKTLALCIGLCLVLSSSMALGEKAAISDTTKVTRIETVALAKVIGPDLTVTSAKVLSDPIVLIGPKLVFVPLEITVKNAGTAAVTKDFNVGAEGKATDGNVYGFDYLAPGEDEMERGGVLCTGLAAGAEKTYCGFLILYPQPITATMQPGSNYEIKAMVDYNLDPDAGHYDWGVSETDETNNELTIYYPPKSMMLVAQKLIVAPLK
ncbi:MAG: hypothetical protein U9N48_03065 [Euryarchaeota archaeon]|nr:hypothetical protein [Euryarchaeota archaeon]